MNPEISPLMSDYNSNHDSGHEIEVLWDADHEDDDPEPEHLARWAESILKYQQATACEVAIKVVNAEESQALNSQYRQKDAPTNVLSFPLDGGQPASVLLLGDLALCAPVVRAEALQQSKSLHSHYAHMVVHGVLHLLGFDHVESGEAEEMEQIEREILHTMGFSDPYLEVGS